MADGFTLDTSRFEAALDLVFQYTKRGVAAEFKTVSKGVMTTLLSITPPAAGRRAGEKVGGADGSDAHDHQRGANSIDRDLHAIFKPIHLKGSRTVNTVFGKRIAQPVSVPTKEKYPDVAAIYAIRNKRRHGGKLTRGRRAAYYVGENKLSALAATLKKRIGYAAAGFAPAAKAVGARLPSYAKGKNAPGVGLFEVTETEFHFHAENLVPYIGAIAEGDMQRRLQYALESQTNAMLRRVPYMAAAAARQAGFR